MVRCWEEWSPSWFLTVLLPLPDGSWSAESKHFWIARWLLGPEDEYRGGSGGAVPPRICENLSIRLERNFRRLGTVKWVTIDMSRWPDVFRWREEDYLKSMLDHTQSIPRYVSIVEVRRLHSTTLKIRTKKTPMDKIDLRVVALIVFLWSKNRPNYRKRIQVQKRMDETLVALWRWKIYSGKLRLFRPPFNKHPEPPNWSSWDEPCCTNNKAWLIVANLIWGLALQCCIYHRLDASKLGCCLMTFETSCIHIGI